MAKLFYFDNTRTPNEAKNVDLATDNDINLKWWDGTTDLPFAAVATGVIRNVVNMKVRGAGPYGRIRTVNSIRYRQYWMYHLFSHDGPDGRPHSSAGTTGGLNTGRPARLYDQFNGFRFLVTMPAGTALDFDNPRGSDSFWLLPERVRSGTSTDWHQWPANMLGGKSVGSMPAVINIPEAASLRLSREQTVAQYAFSPRLT